MSPDRVAQLFNGTRVRAEDALAELAREPCPDAFHEGRPGLVFKDGRLYHFSSKNVVVLSHPADPRTWCKSIDKPYWHASRQLADEVLCNSLTTKIVINNGNARCIDPVPDYPVAQVGSSYQMESGQLVFSFWYRRYWSRLKDHLACRKYYDAMPREHRDILLQIPERRWHVLNLLVRCPGALDLWHSNPAILFMLASNWVFHKPSVQKPIRAARSQIKRKQRRILKWLGFPGDEATRKILAKIEPASLEVKYLLYLRNVIHEPKIRKYLSHLHTIDAGIMCMVTEPRLRPFLTPRFLMDVVESDRYENERNRTTVAYFKGLLEDAEELQKQPPSRIESLAHMMRVCDKLLDEIAELEMERLFRPSTPVPPPPFPGSDQIRPLTSWRLYYQEGKEQHNCLSIRMRSYDLERNYIYSVTAPVRATLRVAKRETDNRWVVAELRGPANSEVPVSAVKAIQAEVDALQGLQGKKP